MDGWMDGWLAGWMDDDDDDDEKKKKKKRYGHNVGRRMVVARSSCSRIKVES